MDFLDVTTKKPGDRLHAREINRIVAAIRGVPLPSGQGAAAHATLLRPFRYKSHDGEHLVCRAFDGDVEGAVDVLVGLPYTLRQLASRAGLDFTYSSPFAREADDGSETEDQVLVPSYEVNDVIYAARVLGGTQLVDDDDYVVAFIDVNVDGRQWAVSSS